MVCLIAAMPACLARGALLRETGEAPRCPVARRSAGRRSTKVRYRLFGLGWDLRVELVLLDDVDLARPLETQAVVWASLPR